MIKKLTLSLLPLGRQSRHLLLGQRLNLQIESNTNLINKQRFYFCDKKVEEEVPK